MMSTTPVKKPPTKGTPAAAVQTLQYDFHETELDAVVQANANLESELDDKTKHEEYSYIWLKHPTAFPPDLDASQNWVMPTNGQHSITGPVHSVWGASYSHITFVRPQKRVPSGTGTLVEDPEKGTHLTLRIFSNDGARQGKMTAHVPLPIHPKDLTDTFWMFKGPKDTQEGKQFWPYVSNTMAQTVEKAMGKKPDFTKQPWKSFSDNLRADIIEMLHEYRKVLEGIKPIPSHI